VGVLVGVEVGVDVGAALQVVEIELLVKSVLLPLLYVTFPTKVLV